MSIENGLFNRTLKVGVGLSSLSTNIFYFTIPWHPQSYIDEIRLANINSGVDSTVNSMVILANGAHYRTTSGTDGRSHIIARDTTDKALSAAEGMFASYTFNPPIYHSNLYNKPYLNVAFVFSASQFVKPFVTVTGRKANAENYIKTDSLKTGIFKDYRVLVGKNQSGSAGTGGIIYDVSGIASGRGGENASQFSFASTNDYIYIGSKRQIDHWDFQVGTAATYVSALTGQYWSSAGNGWSTFTAVDDTSSGNSDTMRFSGVIEGSGLGSSTWGAVVFRPTDNLQLPADPLTVLTDSIAAGTTPPINSPENQPRFWVRFKMNTVTYPVGLNKILPVEEVYDNTGTS